MKRKYSEEDLKKDIPKLYARLDSASVSLILETIERKSANHEPIEGHTYNDLLPDGKAWKIGQQNNKETQSIFRTVFRMRFTSSLLPDSGGSTLSSKECSINIVYQMK